ncbi:MAG: hypothetical protein M1837_001773 [Sclerophora amabilis]|nr:MAG: hypothetical protein M1837_001773 [Sclerophora amabilis]
MCRPLKKSGRKNRKDINVALKIVRVDADTHHEHGREHRIHQHLQDSPVARANITHPGRRKIVQLLDDFALGTSHQCLVLEVMGRDVQARADDHTGGRLPGKTGRDLTRQIALGLDYLWKCGVAHGDLHAGNVLFTAPTITALPEEQIKRCLGEPATGAVRRRDGGPLGPSMPRYLVRPATFRGSDTEAKIVDLGRAFFHNNDPPERLQTPCHMLAPEALFGQPLGPGVDMWSMGCLLFEIMTGRSFVDTILADNVSTITGIESHIGAAPAKWKAALDEKTRERIRQYRVKPMDLERYLRLAYDQDDAQLLDIAEEDDDDGEDEIPIEDYEKAKRELSDEELGVLGDTLRRLLTYLPASRGSPETLLRSPWIQGRQADEAEL